MRWPATEGYGLKRASEANELGVEREREQLRRELHALNYHLILGISPASHREDWDARLRVMMSFLDPTLNHVERVTGWRFGYEAESRNEHHWPAHRFPGP